ncbi:MAG: hypothetical protein R3B13_16340 [Polyangiaceae bacterium]
MSYLFVWGIDAESVRRGIVVDACSSCRDWKPFLVVDHFTSAHVYLVSLSEPRFTGSVRTCLGCQTTFPFQPTRYAEVLPLRAAQTMSLDEGFRRCLPRVAQAGESGAASW